MPLRQLRRVRWAVRASLALGVAASVAANILHALPNPIAQTIAAWPPLALLLTVELISRVPVHRRSLAAVRLAATAAIAGIAAWVSYWHMAAVAARYGETDAAPYLLPLSVDGLVVVASVSLVELAGRIRSAETVPTPAVPTPAVPARAVPIPAVPARAVPPSPAPAPPAPAPPAPAGSAPAPPSRINGSPVITAARLVEPKPIEVETAPARSRPRRPVDETRRLAAEITAAQPDVTHDDLARELGISTKRLRTVLATAA